MAHCGEEENDFLLVVVDSGAEGPIFAHENRYSVRDSWETVKELVSENECDRFHFPVLRQIHLNVLVFSTIECGTAPECVGVDVFVPDVIAFAFFKEPGFLEGDFFVGCVFRLFHSRHEDFMFTELFVTLIDGVVKGRSFDHLIEEAWGDILLAEEAGKRDSDLEGTFKIAVVPEFEKSFGHGDAVLGGREAGVGVPRSTHSFDSKVHLGCPESVRAESSGCFLEESKENIAATLVGSEFGREDVGVPERFVALGFCFGVVTSKVVPVSFAGDAAERLDEFFAVGENEVFGGEDPGSIKADFHSAVNSAKIGQF